MSAAFPRTLSSRLGTRAARVMALLVWAIPVASWGHALAPSLLEIEQRDAHRYEVSWKTPRLTPAGVVLEPRLPERCQLGEPSQRVSPDGGITRSWSMECPGASIIGQEVAVVGLDRSRTAALVRVSFLDGRSAGALLRGSDARFRIPARVGVWEVVQSYVALGFEHILGGPDHLLFVLGLVLLIQGRRQILLAITAFTLGHSITLSFAILAAPNLPSALVEFAIAASILWLAVELTAGAGGSGPLRRWPWGMTCLFGLLHGFGFAGALREAGLPQEEIPMALVSFNVGIELGQILFVSAIWAIRALVQARLRELPSWAGRVPAYAIGSLVAFWCFQRAALIW